MPLARWEVAVWRDSTLFFDVFGEPAKLLICPALFCIALLHLALP